MSNLYRIWDSGSGLRRACFYFLSPTLHRTRISLPPVPHHFPQIKTHVGSLLSHRPPPRDSVSSDENKSATASNQLRLQCNIVTSYFEYHATCDNFSPNDIPRRTYYVDTYSVIGSSNTTLLTNSTRVHRAEANMV